jgi:hypothetical protein
MHSIAAQHDRLSCSARAGSSEKFPQKNPQPAYAFFFASHRFAPSRFRLFDLFAASKPVGVGFHNVPVRGRLGSRISYNSCLGAMYEQMQQTRIS